MVGTVEQIRKDLAVLETATATLAEEFKTLYENYLKMLGKAARRQLILAGYHLCTQAYPEAFLRLSLSQRQKLQEALRTLANDVQNRLSTLMETNLESLQSALAVAESAQALSGGSNKVGIAEMSLAPAEDAPEGTNAALPEAEASQTGGTALNESVSAEDNPEDNTEDNPEDDTEISDMPMVRALLMNAVLEAMDPDLAEADESDQPMTPARLMKRHFLLEQRLRMVLQRVSNGTNRLLQRAQMLPDLPEALLAAATEADIPLEKAASAPNLLNVLVEIARDGGSETADEDDEDEDDRSVLSEEELDEAGNERDVTHLVAIHLRLSDIEFADAQASLWRSKLREAVGKLKQLGSRYQKKQRELAIAEAELAWRSTWYDEAPREEPQEEPSGGE
ncbi:hypothetical protein [Pseudanabaena sp. FACHB-2040]|uniref:hypothetical protein n=1 Tax=Pseudanabaena sp. FACHB-2040 TaxID=2692859 RepID=UPI001682ABF1|nr:hypothetical protein [Pseudanabaena sp. FACHB-2040]MBD2258636.1 hypothetical protein [Pseudanabaena sp. FACHB-2040]